MNYRYPGTNQDGSKNSAFITRLDEHGQLDTEFLEAFDDIILVEVSNSLQINWGDGTTIHASGVWKTVNVNRNLDPEATNPIVEPILEGAVL